MTDETVEVRLDLVLKTVGLLLSVPAGQVYSLIREWDEAIPGLIQKT